MKTRPRLRAAAMWFCTLLATVVLPSTICTRWWTFDAAIRKPERTYIVDAGRGVLTFGWIFAPGFQPTHWQIQKVPGWYWGWTDPIGSGNHWAVAGFMHAEYPGVTGSYSVTLIYPTMIAVVAAGLLWRADAKARKTIRIAAGLCHSCAYNRSGLPAAAPCPECGAQPTPSTAGAGPSAAP